MTAPKKPGHYWAKWKIKSPGTAEEDDPPGGEWEVVQVFVNCIDEADDEYLMVAVAGVERSQSLENFFWGARVSEPPGIVATDPLEVFKLYRDTDVARSHPSVHDLPPCPVCGRMPEVERCEPWPRNHGPAPWYIGCYRQSPHEHFIGGNADTRGDADRVWRDAVMRHLASDRIVAEALAQMPPFPTGD